MQEFKYDFKEKNNLKKKAIYSYNYHSTLNPVFDRPQNSQDIKLERKSSNLNNLNPSNSNNYQNYEAIKNNKSNSNFIIDKYNY